MIKKNKSPEITRLQQALKQLAISITEVAEQTGVSERTITHYICNNTAMGGAVPQAVKPDLWHFCGLAAVRPRHHAD